MRIEPLSLKPVSMQGIIEKPTESAEGQPFGEILAKAIGDVNKLQNDAKTASVKLAAGQIEDVSEVVIATEKASIALQLTMQVRNKVIDAYQEIMRIQV